MHIFRRLFGGDKIAKDQPQPAAPTNSPRSPSLPDAQGPTLKLPDRPVAPTQVAAAVAVAATVAPHTPSYEAPAKDRARRQRDDRTVFGEDTWGVRVDQREAATNPDRLRRFGLPVLYSEHDLADWLGIPLGKLRWYTHDKAADTTWHYVRRTIPKRSGGQRVILAPKKELKAIQRKILADLVAKLPVTANAHGFVKGRSIVTNARQHTGQAVVLNLDLKDFFPSVTFPRVRGLLIAHGYPYAVASALALLCTEYDREAYEKDGTTYYISIGPRHLVQGAPTSPALANLVAWKLDKRLAGLAAKRGYAYTRYADDLTFSGEHEAALPGLRLLAQKIIRDEHFAPNTKKTRIAKQSARQIVTGLVVNAAVATPRSTRRQLRAILHNAQQDGLAAQNREQRRDFRAYLQGMIGHVQNASPQHAAKLRGALEKIGR